MYSIEARLSLRRDPESLIGQYGFYYNNVDRRVGRYGAVHTDTQTAWALGNNRWLTQRLANRLLPKLGIQEELKVEEITSLEQAEQFPTTITKDVTIARFRKPDLHQTLDAVKIPDGHELIGGDAEFWRETRIPTRYVYIVSRGELLDIVEFNQTQGWHPKYDHVEGHRSAKGIITPVAHLKKSDRNVATRKATYF